MDRRIFFAGIVTLAVGITISLYVNSIIPLGKPGMTDAEISQFYLDEATDTSLAMLFQIVAGIGFLLLIISFGLKRKQKGGAGKPITQKPTET